VAPSFIGRFVLIRDYHPFGGDQASCCRIEFVLYAFASHFEFDTAGFESLLRDQFNEVSTSNRENVAWIHRWLISGRLLN